MSKASSLFTHHVSMTQHQHQVSTEAGTSKAKYGLSYRQSFYHCGSCSLASSHDNILSHIKVTHYTAAHSYIHGMTCAMIPCHNSIFTHALP